METRRSLRWAITASLICGATSISTAEPAGRRALGTPSWVAPPPPPASAWHAAIELDLLPANDRLLRRADPGHALARIDEGPVRSLMVQPPPPLRITLSERVLFDTNRARVKRAGKERLREVARAWHTHPHWARIHIEGHTDHTGPERYNRELSELRAARVLAALVELGVPADALSSEGFGSSVPFVSGNSPEVLEDNRRVELVIEWGRAPRR